MTKVLLATGTNAARASKHYTPDYITSTTYFDMLVDKHTGHYTPRLGLPFKLAPNMDSIPDVNFYQLAFPAAVTDEILNDDLRPSWSKATEDPAKAKGFITTVFGGLFNGTGMYDYVAMEHVFGSQPTGIMIWLSEGGRKENIDHFIEVLQSIISDWVVVPLHGDKTNGRGSEKYVKEAHAAAIKNGKKGVVVVSMKLGARSFSVPFIDTVILAYDNGSAAQTAQKMSRCLTRGDVGKIAKVISISLDPTREDKLDAPILTTAEKLADKENIDIVEAVKRVLRTLNIYSMDDNGDRMKLEPDKYLEKVMNVSTLTRVITETADLATIMSDVDMVEKLLKVTAGSVGLGNPKEVVKKGKKFLKEGSKKISGTPKDQSEKEIYDLMVKLQNAINALVDNSIFISGMTPHTTIKHALNFIAMDNQYTEIFVNEFGVDPEFVIMLLDRRVIDARLVDIMISIDRKKSEDEISRFWI